MTKEIREKLQEWSKTKSILTATEICEMLLEEAEKQDD